jgi:Protein O-mannosyl-transferase TMEM260-like
VKTGRFIAVAHKAWDQAGDFLLLASCFLFSLLLYLQTLAPSVATLFDDSLEFPLVIYRLVIAHPTGYPLYTLLGKLFTLGPWQNVAWAVNLLSAVMGALTVALVYLIIRQLVRRRGPALLGALALAVSPVFWSQAVIAEVYTLNAAFVAALLWLALRWSRQPLEPVEPFSLLLVSPEQRRALFLPGEGIGAQVPPALRRAAHRIGRIYRRAFPVVPASRRLRIHAGLYGLAAVYGLGLTHHRTVLLLAPALLLFVVLIEARVLDRAALLGPEHPERPRWRRIAGRPILLLAACFLLPLLLYLYLPLRGHIGSLDGTYANTWSGFWQWVTASGYNVFLAENPLARELNAAFYTRLFWQQFGPVGCALALVGLVGLLRRPKALALTAVAFATYVAFGAVYRVPDVEVFFIPAFLIACVWIGVGLDYALDLLTIRGRSLAMRRFLASCLLLLVLTVMLQPLAIAVRNYPDLDLSRRWSAHDYGQYVLQEPLPANSTIVGLLGEMTLLRYFQDTTGLRPDVETIAADDEAARQAAVDAALARGRTVFLTRPLPGLDARQSLGAVTGLIDAADSLETLVRVGKPSYEVPDLPQATDVEPVPGLQLLGYGMREHRGHWQDWARLRLWWRAPEGLKEALKVSARLVDASGTVDAGGQVVAATDAEPVSGLYPTTAWRPGEVVNDAYEIPLPAGLPPGQYVPQVIVYDPETGEERGRVELAPMTLEGNPIRPPQRALEAGVGETSYARFGDVELLGYTPPDPAAVYRPGESLPLTLLWQARGAPSGVLRASFWLEDGSKVALGEEPVGGWFPSGQWADGQVVRQWSSLQLPDDTPSGTYRLKMRVTRDGQPVPWGRWLLPLGSDMDLGSVSVQR